MNTLDLIILIPIAIGLIMGLFRGLVRELAGIAAVVAGIYTSKIFAPPLSVTLANLFNLSPNAAVATAWLLIFIIVMLVFLILGKLFDKLLSAIALGGVNKILGAVFGAVKFALIISVLLNIFEIIDEKHHFAKPETKENSIFYKPIIKLAPVLWNEAINKN